MLATLLGMAGVYIQSIIIEPSLHKGAWGVPGDPWIVWTGAQFVAHGWLGGLYRSMPGIAEFPLWPVLVAPVRALAGGLDLSVPFFAHNGLFSESNRPTAWLLYGPWCMLGGSVLVFGADAWAALLGVTTRMRALLAFAEAGIVYYVAVNWGHPEDGLALGLLCFSLVAAERGKYRGAGWLIGAALMANPMVVLAAPVLFAIVRRERWVSFILRAGTVPVALLAAPFIDAPGATWRALFEQPNSLANHATPLLALSHRLTSHTVEAGPIRLLALVIGLGAALWIARRRASLTEVAAVVACALAGRLLVEPVADPYYFIGPLAVGILIAARRGLLRLTLASLLAAATLAVDLTHWNRWPWWLLTAGGCAATIALGNPFTRRGGSHQADAPSAWAIVEESIQVPTGASPESGGERAPVLQGARLLSTVPVVAIMALAGVIGGEAAYGATSIASQNAAITASWRAAVDMEQSRGDVTPIPFNPDDLLLEVTSDGAVRQLATLAPLLGSVPEPLATRAKTWSRQAITTVDDFGNLAWKVPAESDPPSHTAAEEWVPALGDPRSPYYRTWLDERPPCPTASAYDKHDAGAPDYRLVLGDGCPKDYGWIDARSSLGVTAQVTQFDAGAFRGNPTVVETDPTGRVLVGAWVPYTVKAGVAVEVNPGASTGSPAAGKEHEVSGAAVAELRVVDRRGRGTLLIYDPWDLSAITSVLY